MHVQNYDECLHVPFILRPPGGRAGTSDELVSLVDVLPTLLSFAGGEPGLIQGLSLREVLTSGVFESAREHVLIDGRTRPLGLRTRRWSLVPTASGLAAFDLQGDPGQELDFLGSEESPAELDELGALLDAEAEALRILREHYGPGEETEAFTPEELETLRALGYGGE